MVPQMLNECWFPSPEPDRVAADSAAALDAYPTEATAVSQYHQPGSSLENKE